MITTPRAQKIQAILDARRPMAEKANQAADLLNSVETSLKQFKTFVPIYASKIEGDTTQKILNLEPEADGILSKIAVEKSKLSLISARFLRPTLNIGMAGRARQGKSRFLQVLTGLTSDEIPTGNKLHCTGAPSVIVNQDIDTAFAEIKFHTSRSFLEDVVAPFFERLGLGDAPSTLSEFRSCKILPIPKDTSLDKTSDEEFIKKLHFLQKNLSGYEEHLTGQRLQIPKEEIRAFIAQDDKDGRREDSNGKPYCKWVAVQLATVYCRFAYQDLGSIALADTPGIGDFVSGAEDRLVSMIGRNLDVLFFMRMPEGIGAMIKPEDTALHSVIMRAIPELSIKDWSYFIINKVLPPAEGNNLGQITSFEEMLKNSAIRTKETLVVDCNDPKEVEIVFNRLLDDIAGNLGQLDKQLFDRHSEELRLLGVDIKAFAAKTAAALPKVAVVAVNQTTINNEFSKVWVKLAFQLTEVAKLYSEKREFEDEDFMAASKAIFEGNDDPSKGFVSMGLNSGPQLPETAIIAKEAAAGQLPLWHSNKVHELRVNISNAFETLDKCLDASFNRLREELLLAFKSEEGGRLIRLQGEPPENLWAILLKLWEGHQDGEIMCNAINKLLSASLSFRGFIQPQIRKCLDVLDSSSPNAAPFAATPGDSPEIVKEKLEMAWEKACYDSQQEIKKLSKIPSMAKFATVEDFVDATLRSGGAIGAEKRWNVFYGENRGEIWPDVFEKLEADTRLRKEWELAVSKLNEASSRLIESK